MSVSDVSKTYTNSDDMEVQVSQEHLDKAVDIKLELQEISFGRKCNWNKHKQLMEQDGFTDSDVNESYRCIIKSYQSKIGKLRKVDSYADYVADGKIEAIKQVVGEMYYAKADNQQVLRELNKIKRGLTTSALAVEELKEIFLDEIEFNIPHYAYQKRLPNGRNKGILIITDWHVGVVVDNVKGNSFNLEIARKRINKLKQEALNYCNLFDINDLYICHLGDAIEHVSMRNTGQAYECELNFSQQIVKATELIVELLVNLAEHVNIEFESIAGNHDRSNGQKSDNIDGDNAIVIINDSIKNFIKYSKLPRLTMIDSNLYINEIIKTVNGKKFKMIHGDEDSGSDVNRIRDHSNMDNEIYDCIVSGHKHSFKSIQGNNGQWIVQVGCLMGRNNYSKKLKCVTNAGQGIIIVRDDGEIIPLPIDLQVN